jgi:lipoprotein-anchoring transpeptidase ErfK/SrfK
MSMHRSVFSVLATSLLCTLPALAEPLSLQSDRSADAPRSVPAYIVPVSARPSAPVAAEPERTVAHAATRSDTNLGGGFIEFLFTGGRMMAPLRPPAEVHANAAPYATQPEAGTEPRRRDIDPMYLRQTVAYSGPEKPGTIIIDTPNRFLYLVQDNGTALRYGIGVGRPGFTWAGVKTVTAKKEWPDWTPPPEMLQRQPDLPSWMAGGPDNPLGARALYLGSSLYRIHGSNEPWTIGQAVSSGCIRMRNEDVIDLYERVRLGTKVVVI